MVGPLVDWSNQADFFPDVGGDVTLLADPADYAHKSVRFDLGCLGIAIGLGSPFRYQVDDILLFVFTFLSVAWVDSRLVVSI